MMVFASQSSACVIPQNSVEIIQETILLINSEREKNGLRKVTVSPELSGAAQSHACDSARRQVMSHTGSDGSDLGRRIRRSGYRIRFAAENLAMGQRLPSQVTRDWMNSPPHRRNILEDRVRELGLAIAIAEDGRQHWVLKLARRR